MTSFGWRYGGIYCPLDVDESTRQMDSYAINRNIVTMDPLAPLYKAGSNPRKTRISRAKYPSKGVLQLESRHVGDDGYHIWVPSTDQNWFHDNKNNMLHLDLHVESYLQIPLEFDWRGWMVRDWNCDAHDLITGN